LISGAYATPLQGVNEDTFGVPLFWSKNMFGLLKDEQGRVKNPLDGIVV